MDWLNNIIIPLLSSIIIGLITFLIQNRITTRQAHRIHRRQLTGLLDEIRMGMIIDIDNENNKRSKEILEKRIGRIIDTFDIATNFKPQKSQEGKRGDI